MAFETIGKTYTVGFWKSQLCDNSLAGFPDGIDNSWGILGFTIDGCDEENYVEVQVLNTTNDILFNHTYKENREIKINLAEVNSISSTQDIYIRMVINIFI